MMKIKVINIITHLPAYDLYKENRPLINWDTPDGSWVGIWGYDWHNIIGNEILKNSNQFYYEVWQPDLRADRIYHYTFEDGLVHKSFPARNKKYINGLKVIKGIFSDLILKELDQMIKNKEIVLLHLNAAYACFQNLILKKFYKEFPMVFQFYTNSLPFPDYRTGNIIKKVHRFFLHRSRKKFYNRVHNVIPASNENNLKERIKCKIYERQFANFGVDFTEWKIDHTKIQARNSLNIPLDKKIILSSSRLTPVKQIDILIQALAKVKFNDYKYYISGHGSKDYERYLKTIVKKLGLMENVIFIGYVEKDILRKYYLASDFFISTSKSEAGPYSSYIAMALNIPIITTDTGIACEFLKREKAGVILPINDFNVWVSELEKVFLGKLIKRVKMGKVKKFFDWQEIAAYYCSVYNKAYEDFKGREK